MKNEIMKETTATIPDGKEPLLINESGMVLGDKIQAIGKPEWGNFTIIEDSGDWFTIRGRSGSSMLSYEEARKFWNKTA